MSNNARTLRYWVLQAASNVAENEADQEFCLKCARAWANFIITGVK